MSHLNGILSQNSCQETGGKSRAQLIANEIQKHRLRSSIPSASTYKAGPANLVVVRWTAKQWVPGTKKIFAEKIVMIGHLYHYDQ